MQASQDKSGRFLLSGNEAIALAARHCGVALGTGYPGTPSTEILENFSALGGNCLLEKIARLRPVAIHIRQAPQPRQRARALPWRIGRGE